MCQFRIESKHKGRGTRDKAFFYGKSAAYEEYSPGA